MHEETTYTVERRTCDYIPKGNIVHKFLEEVVLPSSKIQHSQEVTIESDYMYIVLIETLS